MGQDDHVEDDHREREHDVAGAGDDEIDPAALVAGGQAQQAAQHGGAQHGQRGDDQHRPRAPQDAREDVAAEMVGAEPVRARGRGVGQRADLSSVEHVVVEPDIVECPR